MTTNKNQRGKSARVNGLDLYYELHGNGQPLVVLPGAFWTIEAIGELVAQLATTRRVIAVELQGHGHTADIDRPLSFESMADDIAALITSLGLEQADLFGYSLGGGVALQTAIRHPEEFFGLLGGGKADGDMVGLPPASLAVLPATTHVGWAPPYHGIMTRTHLLLPILTEFFDSPMPQAG